MVERTPPRATIKMVAQRAGVGLASVSRVLSGHPDVSPRMRELVLAAAEECGYETDLLARALRSGRSRTIGIVVGDILNPFLASIIAGAEERLRADGYAVILAHSHGHAGKDVESIRVLLQRRVDGLILSVSDETSAELAPLLSRANRPVVLLDRDVPASGASAVLTDHHAGMAQIVGHLAEYGHRRIGLLLGPLTVRPSRERYRGFIAAMKEHGLDVVDQWVAQGAFSSEFAHEQAVRMLTASARPSALVAGGNQLMTGVLEAVQELDLQVPEEVSLVGCDDVPITRLYRPRITVLARDAHAMGQTAASRLLEALTNQEAQKSEIQLGTELRVRESTGPAPPD